jgi:hypothetical protein
VETGGGTIAPGIGAGATFAALAATPPAAARALLIPTMAARPSTRRSKLRDCLALKN